MARRTIALGVLAAMLVVAAPARAGAAADNPAFGQMLAYKFGADAGPLKAVESIVVATYGKAADRAAVEAKLLAALRSPKATTDCKRFVCRMLVNAGTAKSVPALAALLGDAELSHMGLYALARLTCPEAGQALRDGLGRLQGKPLLGVVNALGDRRDPKAVGALVKLVKHRDAAVREAAIVALGKIGGKEAAACLARRDLASSNSKGRAVVVRARLRCAERLLEAGDRAAARATYQQLYKPSEATHVRAAALRGLLATDPEQSIDLLMKPLTSGDAAMRNVAIGLVRDVRGAAATRAFAAQLPKLPPDTQVLVLDALADRADAAAAAAVIQAAGSRHEVVRVAAIQALADVGDASAVPLLAKALTSGKPAEAAAARSGLNRLGGDGVNAAILEAMDGAEPALRVELIKTLAARRAQEAVPALLEGAAGRDEAVARESFNALRTLAGEKALTAMVALLVKATDGSARGAAERAVVAIAGKVEDEDKRLAPVLAALPKAEPLAKAALVRIAGKFGGPKALAAVRAARKDADPGVQGAALRALADWPDAAPAADLLATVKATQNLKIKVIALRGYVRLLALPSDRPAAALLESFGEAMTLAPRVEEKKLVLAAVADLRHPAALKLLEPYLADKALGPEAKAAKIQKALRAPARVTASVNAGAAKNAIDGNKGTRWDTKAPMRGGEWFLYELPVEHEIRGLVLDTRGSNGDYPRGYEVYVSRDGKSWGKAIAEGKGTGPVTEIKFQPTYSRFIKIVQTGKTDGIFWSIHEIKVDSKLAAQD